MANFHRVGLLASLLFLGAVLVETSAAKADGVALPDIPADASDGIWLGVGDPTFLLEADEAQNNTFTIPYTGSAFIVYLSEPITKTKTLTFSDVIVANGQTLTFTSGLTLSSDEEKKVLAENKALVETGDWQNLFATYPSVGQDVWVFSRVDAVPLPAALPLFASGLAGLGWLAGRRRKQSNHA